MKEPQTGSLHFDALREIRRVDCSTSKCRANGRCTGELRRHPMVGWGAVYYCPDCRSTGLKSTLPIRQLCEQLLRLSPEEQVRTVCRFVDTRPDGTRALSAPWTG